MRIVTPEGHTVVDAAHIVRWSRTRNDDIRNGMALCKLCHWAFDEGMMGVCDNYNVITSRQIGLNPNVPGFLLTLTGRGIIPPADQDLWPARVVTSDISPLIRPPATFSLMEKGCVDLRKWNE